MPEDQESFALQYYQIVRSTIGNIDSMRINTISYGVSISCAVLVAAFTVHNYVGQKLGPVPLGDVLAVFLCVINMLVIEQFRRKISMFNFFVRKAVDIARQIEDKIFEYGVGKLTISFEEHEDSGKGGDRMFIECMRVMNWASILTGLVFLFLLIQAVLAATSKLGAR